MGSPSPPTASVGRPGRVGLSALQMLSDHWAPCEDKPPADPLGRDEPLDASSSPRSSRERRALATATMSPQLCGEATAWTTRNVTPIHHRAGHIATPRRLQ
jgi:hypothetical protein